MISFMALGFILLLGATLWIMLAFLQRSEAPTETKDVQRISVQAAKAAFDQGQAIILDVRGQETYANQHIRGAENIPLDELQNRLDELNPSGWIITYCT